MSVDFAAGFTLDERRGGRRLCWPRRSRGRRGRPRGGLPRAARAGGVRGLRPDHHRPAGQPARAARSGWSPCTTASSWCWPTARSCRCRPGTTVRRRSWSAGCRVRRPAGRWPICSPAWPTRPGKLAETIPVRLEDNPSYLNFPGDSQVVRYGEGSSSATAAYDKSVGRRQLSLRLRALVHLVRPSRPRRRRSPGRWRVAICAWRSAPRSPTSARSPGQRWSRSTSATSSPRSPDRSAS